MIYLEHIQMIHTQMKKNIFCQIHLIHFQSVTILIIKELLLNSYV